MKNSTKIKAILVQLAMNDQLPMDMNQLDESLFSQFDDDPNTIKISWHIDDVKGHAELMEVEINDEEAREILSGIEADHDASIGVNWENIEYHIQEFVDERDSK